MGVCLSCLKGRQKQEGENEPLLYEEPVEQVEEPTPKTRDLEAVIAFVGDNFVDIDNIHAHDPLSEQEHQQPPPHELPEFTTNWIWPELDALGHQNEQIVDDVYNSLKSTISSISLATPTPLTVDLS